MEVKADFKSVPVQKTVYEDKKVYIIQIDQKEWDDLQYALWLALEEELNVDLKSVRKMWEKLTNCSYIRL